MKARIKGLNEIVDVVEEKDVIHNRTLYYNKATHQHYPEDMVEIVDDYATEKVSYIQMPIDWQHYRIQAAIAAMQSIADTLGSVDYNKELITKHAVELADALIAELQKKGE